MGRDYPLIVYFCRRNRKMKKIILAAGCWPARLRLICLMAGGFLALGLFAQQDAQYSQYMFNQLALNPAYAGSREVLSSTLLYRDQWTGIQGAPSTGAFSIQSPIKNKKIGIGAELISDKLGPKSVTSLLGSYSYRIPFMKGKLSFGLRLGMYDYVIDWNKIEYKDQNDVYNTHNKTSKITGTGDFGMYYYTRTFYWGVSYDHINKGKISDSGLDSSSRQAVHFFMPVGKAFMLGKTVFNPTLVIKAASHAPASMDLSLNLLLKERLWLGMSFRSGYGVVFLTQFLINEHMKAGYSYDIGKNKIGNVGKGSHEIMIGYDINIHSAKVFNPRFL